MSLDWVESANYWVYGVLLLIGLYTIIARPNLVKKVIGLGILQTGVFLLFVSLAHVAGGTAPILDERSADDALHANPLPHVLILTAIVVSVSTMSVALALCIRIHEEWGTLESDELHDVGPDDG